MIVMVTKYWLGSSGIVVVEILVLTQMTEHKDILHMRCGILHLLDHLCLLNDPPGAEATGDHPLVVSTSDPRTSVMSVDIEPTLILAPVLLYCDWRISSVCFISGSSDINILKSGSRLEQMDTLQPFLYRV